MGSSQGSIACLQQRLSQAMGLAREAKAPFHPELGMGFQGAAVHTL